jgi:BlaI family transcriptional regulator, penicillinase repressor
MSSAPVRSRAATRRKPSAPSISDAEWVVMTEFWRLGEATAKRIVGELAGRQHWKPKTVQTLVNRLVQKGVLGFRKEGREHVYQPLFAEAQCLHEASKSFVDRVFGGRLAPLLACFLEREECSAEEIEEMRRMLKKEPRP